MSRLKSKCKLIVGLMALLCVASCAKTDDEIYAEAISHSVYIRGAFHQASGVVIKSDQFGSLILTNKHVCQPNRLDSLAPKEIVDMFLGIPEYVYFYAASKDSKGEPVVSVGQVVKVSANSDLCLIHTQRTDLVPAKLAAAPAKTGDEIFSCGNPLGVRDLCFTGRVGPETYELFMLYQITSMPANPGQSGSGVFNKDGELIGVVSLGGAGLSAIVPLSLIQVFVAGLI